MNEFDRLLAYIKKVRNMSLQLIGKKQGMTRLFNEKGELVVCSVISAEPNVIAQIKHKDTDGYTAVQLGGGKVPSSKIRNVSKPLKGHFSKSSVEPRNHLVESRVEDLAPYSLGQEIGVEYFSEVAYVDVSGVSKGKGHQGVMKRHGFAGGPASHGSGFHRHGGSCGMRSSPGRCLPGQKKSGRMGGERVTVEKLRVVAVDAVKGVLLVAGAIPGPSGGLVYVRKSKKA